MKPSQEKVYNYIKQFYQKHGLMPTVREIGKGVNMKSSSSVAYHLRELRKQGLVTDSARKSRSCKIVGDDSITFYAKWQMLKEWLEAEKQNATHKAEQCTSGYDLLYMMINDYGKVLDEMNKLENGDKNENKSPKVS